MSEILKIIIDSIEKNLIEKVVDEVVTSNQFAHSFTMLRKDIHLLINNLRIRLDNIKEDIERKTNGMNQIKAECNTILSDFKSQRDKILGAIEVMLARSVSALNETKKIKEGITEMIK